MAKRKLDISRLSIEPILDSLGIWLCIADRNLDMVAWNRAAERRSGYLQQQARESKKIWQLLYPDKRLRTTLHKQLQSMLEGEGQQRVDTTALNKNNVPIPITWQAARVQEENLDQWYAVGMETAGLQVQQALAQSEQKYRSLFDNSRDGIYISTLQGDYIDANPALVNILGYSSREELVAKNISKDIYKHQGQRPGPEQREKPFEVKFKRKDGTSIWVEVSSKVMYKEGRAAYYQGIVRDISDRKKYEQKLRYASFHDQLTGLYNRAYFEEELQRLDKQRQLPLSIIIGDVNCLKLTNDAFGHHCGDQLLKKAARVLKKACRKEDMIARWGGDEFAVILPRTSAQAADEATARMKDGVQKYRVSHIPLSISVGRATKSKKGQCLREVIREAEDRMYRQKMLQRKQIPNQVLQSFEQALYQKCNYSRQHGDRVKNTALRLAKALGLSAKKQEQVALLGFYHDIGKIALDEQVLNKKQALTPQQWKLVKRHPEIGYNIAKSMPRLCPIAESLLAHHERWDGKGYPQGLAGQQIPVLARILALVDACDVMEHGCSYKKRMTAEEVAAELKKHAGTQFDPHLVKIFLQIEHK